MMMMGVCVLCVGIVYVYGRETRDFGATPIDDDVDDGGVSKKASEKFVTICP